MARTAVESSNIEAVEYFTEDNSMEVDFKSGTTYAYLNVPFKVYQEFLDAPSQGKFFNQYIKPEYEFCQI